MSEPRVTCRSRRWAAGPGATANAAASIRAWNRAVRPGRSASVHRPAESHASVQSSAAGPRSSSGPSAAGSSTGATSSSASAIRGTVAVVGWAAAMARSACASLFCWAGSVRAPNTVSRSPNRSWPQNAFRLRPR